MALGIVHDIAPGARSNNVSLWPERWRAYPRGSLPPGIKYVAVDSSLTRIIASTGTSDSCYMCQFNGIDVNISNWTQFSLPGPVRPVTSISYQPNVIVLRGAFIITLSKAAQSEPAYYYALDNSTSWQPYAGQTIISPITQGALVVAGSPWLIFCDGVNAAWAAYDINGVNVEMSYNRAPTRSQACASQAVDFSQDSKVVTADNVTDVSSFGHITISDGFIFQDVWNSIRLPNVADPGYGLAVRRIATSSSDAARYIVVGITAGAAPNQIWYSDSTRPNATWRQGTISFNPLDPNKAFGTLMLGMTNEEQIRAFYRSGIYYIHCSGTYSGLLTSTDGINWKKVYNPYNINDVTMALQPEVEVNGVMTAASTKAILISNNGYINICTSPN